MVFNTVDYITEALKNSLEVKRNTSDRERKRLEDRKEKLLLRLDRLYEDKLDNEITEDFYNRKFEEYSDQVTELDVRIAKYTKADIDYYRYGSSILQLAQKAATLYRMANDDEKRELLGYLLSNCQLLDKEVVVTYRKPFDIIMKRKEQFRTQENSSTKAKNTISGALPSIERREINRIRTTTYDT